MDAFDGNLRIYTMTNDGTGYKSCGCTTDGNFWADGSISAANAVYINNAILGMRSYYGSRTIEVNLEGNTTQDVYIQMRRGTTAGSYYTRIRNAPNAGISANRDIYFPNAGGTLSISSSDIRLKNNISDTEIDNALDIINQIKVRSFDWNDGSHPHQKIGFVADELEEIDERLAEGGGYEEDGSMIVKTVDTFYMLGYIVKAIQEISDKLNK